MKALFQTTITTSRQPERLRSLRALLLIAALAASALTSRAVDAAIEATLALDPSHPGAAISPYIYGQFIEHLGRCIHDGVWAEKLRDRKFFQPLDKSAWQVVRGADAEFGAYLDPAGAFAGEHCLALWRRDQNSGGCGLVQQDLGVIAGKDYVGYAWVSVASGEPVLEATLAWGDGPDDRQTVRLTDLGREYRRVPFRFHAGKTTESASFSLHLTRPGLVWLGCLSLMPADNVKGMRADVLALIKKLNSPIMRWPGGNFVSGYHWKDGIGERDRRPPRWERAWNDVEDNDFGLDEFMTFCAEVGTEPYISVNTGLGSVEEAADEVEYATGKARTRWGAERARHGHAKPYQVTWWGIGNEMYGNWQLGSVPVERYALRHNAFVEAMRAKSPSAKFIAVGAPGPWNDLMLSKSADHMDLLSGHHYTERKFRAPFSAEDERKYEEHFLAYSGSVMEGVRRVVNDYRQRLGKGNADLDRVRLAIDEWGIVRDWNAAPDGPGVSSFEHYYPLGDALASARALHELLRSADVVGMANWAQTVNVIGAIKTSRNYAVLDSVGHLLALYRARVGGNLVPAKLTGDAPLDAVAAVEKKTGQVSIGLINYSPDQEVAVRIDSGAAKGARGAQVWRINGPSLGAINVPGQPAVIATEALLPICLAQPVRLPPHSITVLTWH